MRKIGCEIDYKILKVSYLSLSELRENMKNASSSRRLRVQQREVANANP